MESESQVMAAQKDLEYGEQSDVRHPRRRFLVLAGSLAATLGASRAAPAASLASRLRDRWLFERLADRCPMVGAGVAAWPMKDGEFPVGWIDEGPALALNETAAFLLERCRGEMTVEQMAQELRRVLGAPIDVARRDAALTIRAFHRLGLVAV